MTVTLRPNIKIKDPEQVILHYYQTMGKGVHCYDQTKLPEDSYFPTEQLKEVKHLVDRLGGRGIPQSAISALDLKKSKIEETLQKVPATVSILAAYQEIPWNYIRELIDILRVPYLGIARLTKMLHKKRPNVVPILDSVMVAYLRHFIDKHVIRRISDAERAICYTKELKKDVDNNRAILMQLYDWKGKPYPILVPRILDILVWSTQGPFRDRFAHLIN